MHRGLEVRPSQRAGSWRVGVVSRARNGAVVCWHKGLEGLRPRRRRGEEFLRRNATRVSPEDVACVQEGKEQGLGSFFVPAAVLSCCRRERVDG